MTTTFNIKLKVLVFGPSTSINHPPGFTADLARKRLEIRDALIADGHEAVFPEDLMHGAVDPAINSIYIWEQMLVQEYDMVVNLVGSFGAVDELSLFSSPDLARKAALFFNQNHTTGLAFDHAKVIEAKGAKLHTFTYPDDLTRCDLMKHVRYKVWAVRVGKFYAS
jgi:hypothetical protein